ncbi:hypothetical protein BJ508DRAFT_302819 [Ascobolus immersus RN42]|uniref:Uncharacterized protein n=1 Tax=Ascobolus immersus RN42 TaxID=1160509 RepID=A0A3N4IHE2_ASCIM|nr:hypothetical protein BJ508DRAFT_302819 [Ascobolus immersus RN42]
MRYGNWDVLLFPSGSRVPIQEFGVSCFHCFDPATSEGLRNLTPNGSTTNVDVQYLTRTVPTVTAFITALPAQTPFHISLHCWNTSEENGTQSTGIGDFHGHMRSADSDVNVRQFEFRVFIDDVSTTVVLAAAASTLWPTIIDSQPRGTGSSLLFPEFRSEYMEREWSGISGTGRINVILSEGVTSPSRPYRRLKNLAAFSFVYAPNDVLEWAGISYPRSTFGSSRSPDTALPSLAHYLRRVNGPSSRSTMERPYPISAFSDRTAEIANRAIARASSPAAAPSPSTTDDRPALARLPSLGDELGGGIATRRGLSLRMRIARPNLQRAVTIGADGDPFMGAPGRRNIPSTHTVSANQTPNDPNEIIAVLRAEIDSLRADNLLLANRLEAVTGTRWSPGNFDAIPVPSPPASARSTRNGRPPLATRNTMPNTRSPAIPELGREESPTRREHSLPRFMQSPSSLGIETTSGELGLRDPFEEFINFPPLASSPAPQSTIANPFTPPRASRLRSESTPQSRENSWLAVNENVAPSPSGSLGSLAGSVVTTPQPLPEGQRQLGEAIEQADPLEGAASPESEQESETPRMNHASLVRDSP